MKKVNGKYIRLTESDLKRIVNEEIEKLLEFKNPRKLLVNAARNYIKELIKHWCIVRFYRITQLPTKDFDHWIGEIANFINEMADVHLKGNMDDFDTRKTAIIEGFKKEGVLEDESLCEKYFLKKLMEERVNYSKYKDLIASISQECFNELPLLINIIARGDVYEIGDYVNKL